MALYEFEGKKPQIGRNSYVHPEAVLIGDVVVGEGCYIGAGSVLRADYGVIVIDDGTNIQDGCIIHADPGTAAEIGSNNLIGHGAVLHGPLTMGEKNLIGMRATVLMGCSIGNGCVIGAMSLVTPNTKITNRKTFMGIPAKEVKDTSDQVVTATLNGVNFYRELARRSLISMKKIADG